MLVLPNERENMQKPKAVTTEVRTAWIVRTYATRADADLMVSWCEANGVEHRGAVSIGSPNGEGNKIHAVWARD